MKNRTVKAHFKNYCLGFFAKKFTKNVLYHSSLSLSGAGFEMKAAERVTLFSRYPITVWFLIDWGGNVTFRVAFRADVQL